MIMVLFHGLDIIRELWKEKLFFESFLHYVKKTHVRTNFIF